MVTQQTHCSCSDRTCVMVVKSCLLIPWSDKIALTTILFLYLPGTTLKLKTNVTTKVL